MRRNRSFS